MGNVILQTINTLTYTLLYQVSLTDNRSQSKLKKIQGILDNNDRENGKEDIQGWRKLFKLQAWPGNHTGMWNMGKGVRAY